MNIHDQEQDSTEVLKAIEQTSLEVYKYYLILIWKRGTQKHHNVHGMEVLLINLRMIHYF